MSLSLISDSTTLYVHNQNPIALSHFSSLYPVVTPVPRQECHLFVFMSTTCSGHTRDDGVDQKLTLTFLFFYFRSLVLDK